VTARRFIDTNVIVYLLSADPAKADRAEAVLAEGGIVSVQVLNEFVSVAGRKLKLAPGEICEVLTAVRAACEVVPLTVEVHDLGFDLAERHHFAIYDAMIVAAALIAGCGELVTEDLQHGQVVNGLRIVDPFR
jgi:predicted nucleic acid-binding protein